MTMKLTEKIIPKIGVALSFKL